ncbi:MAG: right-handed parallel beta-helix repeat-containing protein [Verrucomicrobiales bacterium]|nr:right-handed parallel beta-helix repeat-containing protein [Verrucomicrobiales bacterium]
MKRLPPALLLFGLSSFLSGPVRAATFTVTSTADAGGGSLREAVSLADAAPGADEIVFDTAGVFATPQAITLNSPLSFAGTLTITGPQPVQHRVALRGAAAGTRLFAPNGSAVTLTLSDLLVEDAHAVGPNAGGGVMRAGAGTVVTLNANRCIFDDCVADGLGGLFRFATATMTLTDCTFTDNAALGGALLYVETGFVTIRGGATARNASTGAGTHSGDLVGIERGSLRLDAVEMSETTAANLAPLVIEVGLYTGNAATRGIVPVTMTNCNFHDNEGAVLKSNGGPITAAGCTFTDNAGLVLSGGLFDDAITISSCTFTGNDGLASNDGTITVEDTVAEDNGMSFVAGAALTLRRVTLRQNDALPSSQGTLTAEDCEFHQNAGTLGYGTGTIRDITLRRCAVTATTGAAVGYEMPGLVTAGTSVWLVGRNVLLESCTLDGNTGTAEVFTTAKLLNCTFSSNSGQAVVVTGGTDDSTPDLTVQNCVFSGNTVTNAGGLILQATDPLRSFGGNFIDATQPLTWFNGNPGPGDQIGTPATPLNALLGPLRDWGGGGRSRMPLAGSPLIDGGHPAPAAPDYQEPILDQTGRPRVTGVKVDTGAVEALNQFIVTNTNSNGAGSFRDAVNSAAGLQNGEVVFDSEFFAIQQTITLASPVGISASVKISGPPAGVALSGGNANRLLNITGATTQCVIERVQFKLGESAADGGAVNMATGGGGLLTLRECLFSQNHSGGRGGALAISGGTVKATNCLWNNNTADLTGGGVVVVGPGVGYFTNCTMSANSAQRGGGGLVADNGGATLINCTVTSNTADSDTNDDGNGGGLRVVGGATPLRLGNSVVSGNTDASTGGGAVIHPDISGAFETLGHNFIGKREGQTANGTQVTHGVLGDQAGTSATPLNPDLAALAQNGGLFRTQKPNAGSPLIDTGDAALLTDAAWPAAPVYDARVQFRTVAAAPDIGAVEASDVALIQFFVESPPASVEEGAPGSQARYVLRRSLPGVAVDVLLVRSLVSTAAATDFTLTGPGVWSLSDASWTARFSAAELEKIVLLVPLDDPVFEGNETAIVFATPTLTYLVQTAPQAERTTMIVSNELLVTNTNDSGAGSLRTVLTGPAALVAPMIVFDPAVFSIPRTITLASPISVGSAVSGRTVQGPPVPLTLSGGGTSRIIYTHQGAVLALQDLNIANGSSVAALPGDDSGLSALTVDGGSSLTLRRCCVRNCASLSSGGAVLVGFGCRLDAENCTFSQNTAPKHGGAIYVWPDGQATLTHCTLAENHADTDLSGDGEGGAVYIAPNDNSGAFFSDGFLSIQGCHVSLNTDQLAHVETDYFHRARHIALPNPSTGALHNGGGNFFTSPFDQGWLPNDDVLASQNGWVANAGGLVLPLAYSGGPTMTYALAANSPARGACHHFFSLTDQRGIARDNISDAGAFNLASESYEFWAAYRFPPGASQADRDDDPDSDGVANLMEQVMGTDPTDGESVDMLQLDVSMIIGPNFTTYDVALIFPRSPRVGTNHLLIERSTDLLNWQVIETTDTVSAQGEREIIIANMDYEPFDPRREDPVAFFRLKAVEP